MIRHVYIDLDETLIASPENAEDESIYPTTEGTPMLVRPFAHWALTTLQQGGPLFLYTRAIKSWADSALDRFGLGHFFAHRFYRGQRPPVFPGLNFLIDNEALTIQQFEQKLPPDDGWVIKSRPFRGALIPVPVAAFEMDGIDKGPNLMDAVATIHHHTMMLERLHA